MPVTLRPRLSIAARTAALAAVVFTAHSTAVAGYIVDTGAPTGIDDALVIFNDTASGSFASLGASFILSSAQTLTSVEGWINVNSTGTMIVSLWTDAPSVASAPLFSTTSTVAQAKGNWVAFDGLSWSVGPGTYTVTFAGAPEFDGGMADHAPDALSAYYFFGEVVPDWTQTFGENIGVRVVAAVPEPSTYAFMLGGLLVIGFRARSRGVRLTRTSGLDAT